MCLTPRSLQVQLSVFDATCIEYDSGVMMTSIPLTEERRGEFLLDMLGLKRLLFVWVCFAPGHYCNLETLLEDETVEEAFHLAPRMPDGSVPAIMFPKYVTRLDDGGGDYAAAVMQSAAKSMLPSITRGATPRFVEVTTFTIPSDEDLDSRAWVLDTVKLKDVLALVAPDVMFAMINVAANPVISLSATREGAEFVFETDRYYAGTITLAAMSAVSVCVEFEDDPSSSDGEAPYGLGRV